MKTTITTAAKKKTENLKKRSSMVIDVVTTVIEHLTEINTEIDETTGILASERDELMATELELKETQAHNNKIIDKFKALIEV
jgi:hypothetical protein